ncbi:MAG: FMN-binding protein [Deltaproteobacteria bacterium]|nr:FMN-binding protein [Deltaproteobacteria bacterium]
MRNLIKMVVVMTILSALSGGLLAGVRGAVRERIKGQELAFLKGPAIKELMKGAQGDPVESRFTLKGKDTETVVFVGVFDGKPTAVALEASGKGYGKTPVSVLTAINLADDTIRGVAVTTHSETPGLGARAKTDPSFAKGFAGLSALEPVKVKAEGGKIDALSGATITSKGVCMAVTRACELYRSQKAEIVKQAESAAKGKA